MTEKARMDELFCRACGEQIKYGEEYYTDQEYMGEVLCAECWKEYLSELSWNARRDNTWAR